MFVLAVPIALQIDVYPIAQLKRRIEKRQSHQYSLQQTKFSFIYCHFNQTSRKINVEILMKVMLSLGEIHSDIVECVNTEIKILINNDDTRHFARRYNAEARYSEFPI